MQENELGSIVGGIALLLLSLFMGIGFLRSDVDATAWATIIALLITIVLPAAGGVLLLRRHFGGAHAKGRREALRRRTLEAEVLTLAGELGGRLTIVEVVARMAVTPDAAREALDSLMTAGFAEIEVTDAGLLVYSFHDIQQLPEKAKARGILED